MLTQANGYDPRVIETKLPPDKSGRVNMIKSKVQQIKFSHANVPRACQIKKDITGHKMEVIHKATQGSLI